MPIAVYGATGRTGGLVAAALRARGVPCVAGGRDAAALARVAGAEARVATLDDPSALDRLLAGCEVVVNCSGPHVEVAEAAVRNGVDLVDASGAQGFVRRLLDDLGPAAARAGSCVVPCLGFDYAVGDCLARLAGAGVEPVEELVVAYAIAGGGTAGDAIVDEGAGEAGEVVFTDDALRPPPAGVRRSSFTFPGPLGRQVMQRYGSGEPLTVPRHTATRSVVTLITASTWAPHPALVPALPYLRPLAAAARGTPVTGRALALAGQAAARRRPPPGEEAEARHGASFTVAAVARGQDGRVGRALAEGGDFDRVTAAALAAGATRLFEEGRPAVGGLAPAEAFDPAWLLDALADEGVRWRRE